MFADPSGMAQEEARGIAPAILFLVAVAMIQEAREKGGTIFEGSFGGYGYIWSRDSGVWIITIPGAVAFYIGTDVDLVEKFNSFATTLKKAISLAKALDVSVLILVGDAVAYGALVGGVAVPGVGALAGALITGLIAYGGVRLSEDEFEDAIDELERAFYGLVLNTGVFWTRI